MRVSIPFALSVNSICRRASDPSGQGRRCEASLPLSNTRGCRVGEKVQACLAHAASLLLLALLFRYEVTSVKPRADLGGTGVSFLSQGVPRACLIPISSIPSCFIEADLSTCRFRTQCMNLRHRDRHGPPLIESNSSRAREWGTTKPNRFWREEEACFSGQRRKVEPRAGCSPSADP
ncbi:hypothetical protein Krac_1615 [Ktedonobacter racemifer DSM 44963]|uniref:Uncharacterized protein n=1 Tax=Ktedonobacter racemifer DSM 44963 TaxID=485913 RepID=D6U2K5_KTERA|nr:hypothetical protein Krac_1615 [Ktedonobacter racemifer DSM 44963]